MLFIVLLGLAPVVLVALGAAVVEAIDRVREIRRHARVLSDLGTPVTPAAAFGAAKHEVITVEGKLVSIASADDGPDHHQHAQLISFHPYGTSFLDEVNVYAVTHSSAPKSFAIELDGEGAAAAAAGRVVLDGPLQVLRGAIETEHTATLDKAAALDAEPLGRAKVKKRVGQFRVVKPGDRVRARGAVEPAPDDDALYRARSNVLRMTPGPSEPGMGEPKIAVSATTTAQRRRLQPLRGGLVAIGASTIIGAVLATVAVRTDLQSRLPSSSPKSSASPTDTLAPPCRAVVLAKLSKYDVADPSSSVQSCDDPRARAMAHYAAGDFAAASTEFTRAATKDATLVPSLTEVETHVFAHMFEEAASVVRRMNAQFYPGPSTVEKRHLECILDVLAQRAHRAHANEKPSATADGLRAGPTGPRFVKVCSTRPFLKLARQLDSEGRYRGEDDWPRATYVNDTRYDAVGEPFTAVIATRSRLTARPVGLERDLLDRFVVTSTSNEQPTGAFGNLDRYFDWEAQDFYPITATWAAELTLFYAHAGFPERSAPYWPILDRVANVLETTKGPGSSFHRVNGLWEGEKKQVEDERTLLTFAMAIGGAAALYSGDLVRMKRYTGLGEPYASQASRQMSRVTLPSSVWEDPVVDGGWPEHKAVFDAAMTGKASEVVRVLTEQHTTGRTTLPRALPLLGAADRSPLANWFHSDAFPSACLTCGASTYLGDISDRREIARLLDDSRGERDRLRVVAERFTTALTDPEIGFETDELETFFSKRKQ